MNVQFNINSNMNMNMNSNRNMMQPMNNDKLMSEMNESQLTGRRSAISVSFGPLGNFSPNNPILLTPPKEQLQPSVMETSSKDTSYVFKRTKAECKEALEKWVDEQCCKSKKPLEDGHFGEVYSFNALEYVLETYNEKRSLVCGYTPLMAGEQISAVGSAPIPDPWSMACQPSALYVDDQKRITLPCTDVVQPCFGCNGLGVVRCGSCQGSGKDKCSNCFGNGTRMGANGAQERCPNCGGSGQSTCNRCGGDGKITCTTCRGNQQLKFFVQVLVQFVNHVDKYTKEKSELPDELIGTVKGEILASNEGKQLAPISDSDDKDISQNSGRLLQKASQGYVQERRIIQRHVLNCVVCSECELECEDKKYKFWVYGEERKIYMPEYPGGCCCTIL